MFKIYYILTYPLTLVCIGFIWLYKLTISKLGRWCNSMPTCSSFGLYAVKQYGAILGGILAARRILRCHKIKGEYDFVPPNLCGDFKWKC